MEEGAPLPVALTLAQALLEKVPRGVRECEGEALREDAASSVPAGVVLKVAQAERLGEVVPLGGWEGVKLAESVSPPPACEGVAGEDSVGCSVPVLHRVLEGEKEVMGEGVGVGEVLGQEDNDAVGLRLVVRDGGEVREAPRLRVCCTVREGGALREMLGVMEVEGEREGEGQALREPPPPPPVLLEGLRDDEAVGVRSGVGESVSVLEAEAQVVREAEPETEGTCVRDAAEDTDALLLPLTVLPTE